MLRLFQAPDGKFYLDAEENIVNEEEHENESLDKDTDEDSDEDFIVHDLKQKDLNLKEPCFEIRDKVSLAYNNEDDADEYELLNGNELIKDLVLEIGGNQIFRYNCCIHKTNIAVRKSVKNNPFVQTLFKEISKFASQSNKVIALAQIHRS